MMIRLRSRDPENPNLKTLAPFLDNHPSHWAHALWEASSDLYDSMVQKQRLLPPGAIMSGYWIRELEEEGDGAKINSANQGAQDEESLGFAGELSGPIVPSCSKRLEIYKDNDIPEMKPEPMDVGKPTACPEPLGEVLVKHFLKRFSAHAADKLVPKVFDSAGARVEEDPGRRWSSFLNCHTFAQRFVEEVLGCTWPKDVFPPHDALWMDMAIDTMYIQTRFAEKFGKSHLYNITAATTQALKGCSTQ